MSTSINHFDVDDPRELSPREQQVFICLCQDLNTKQTAEKLHISVRTVEQHRASIQRKFNKHNGAALLHYALQHNIVRLDENKNLVMVDKK